MKVGKKLVLVNAGCLVPGILPDTQGYPVAINDQRNVLGPLPLKCCCKMAIYCNLSDSILFLEDKSKGMPEFTLELHLTNH